MFAFINGFSYPCRRNAFYLLTSWTKRVETINKKDYGIECKSKVMKL